MPRTIDETPSMSDILEWLDDRAASGKKYGAVGTEITVGGVCGYIAEQLRQLQPLQADGWRKPGQELPPEWNDRGYSIEVLIRFDLSDGRYSHNVGIYHFGCAYWIWNGVAHHHAPDAWRPIGTAPAPAAAAAGGWRYPGKGELPAKHNHTFIAFWCDGDIARTKLDGKQWMKLIAKTQEWVKVKQPNGWMPLPCDLWHDARNGSDS